MVTIKEQWANFPRDNYVIATSFNFDWKIIESLVCLDSGRRKESIVIVDKKQHNQTKPHNPPLPLLGKTYYVCPSVGLDNTFHPKVVVGFDGHELLLVIGSHNLSTNGTESNLEISGFLRIPLTDPNLEIIERVNEFLEGLAGCIPRDPIAKDHVLNFCELTKNIVPGETKSCNLKFIHSFNDPMLEQVLNQIPKVKQVTIIAPTHSSNGYFVDNTIESLGGAATFIVDPSRFSIENSVREIYGKYNVKKIELEGHRPLHAKIYVFHTEDGDWTLYGSPNFSEVALSKSVKEGGNVEAACLIPPSKNWNWTKLFETDVTLSDASWSDFNFKENDEDTDEQPKIVVEKWGYENSIGQAIIFAPGLEDGTVVFVSLDSLKRKIKSIVKNRQIVFKIPPSWNGSTRFEVFDESENLIVSGDLNRTGAIVQKLEKLDLNEAAQRRFYFFTRRLHGSMPKWIKQLNKDIGVEHDFFIDPSLMRVGHGSLGWSPVSLKFESLGPEQIYNKAYNRLFEFLDNYPSSSVKPEVVDVFVRELQNSLDLLFEAAFFAGLYSKEKIKSLAVLSLDLCELLNLPCGERNSPTVCPNFEEWNQYFFEKLDVVALEKWKKYAPRSCLDLSILFDYWVYFQIRGRKGLESNSLDAVIVTNRYYQVWRALQILGGQKVVSASRQRVFDNRIAVLSSAPKIDAPRNIEELENCLKIAFQKCQSKLK